MVPNILKQIILFSINHLFALKWFQILPSNKNSFIGTELNGFKHCYVTLIIQFRHTVKKFQVLCNEKRGRNSFTPTMLLAPTFRVTRLCNSHQLLLTQCLLSTLRITPPLPRQFGLFIASSPHMQITTTRI